MRISREEALAFASVKKKLHVIKKGQAWLFAPYMEQAAYHSVHWLHDQHVSVQCDGPTCKYCPQKTTQKVHVPAFVCKKPYLPEAAEGLKFPQGVYFNSAHWGTKIVELTSNCFAALNQDSKPMQLAVAWRPGNRNNGPLFFKWIDGILREVPNDLEELDVDKVLPGIIGGRYVGGGPVPLDNPPPGRIKHNLPYQTLEVDNRDYPAQSYRGEPDKFNREAHGCTTEEVPHA